MDGIRAAATYTRSSKDRSDGCSIAAQDKANKARAVELDLPIVATFSDVVESAKDEHRPSFQRLLSELGRKNRGWDTLIIYDTSRLARNQAIALGFKHECRKQGVDLIFATLPEGMSDVSRRMLEGNFELMDEIHSMLSKEKGLAGMAENVRAGHRAGGRAPVGYRLQHEATGAVRDGRPVMKSRLVPDDKFDQVRRYFELRCSGTAASRAARLAGLTIAKTSLTGMDRNALTYAGCTVWNKCNEKISKGGKYVGGKKYRPRSEWVVKPGTHKAMISIEQAEALIATIENSNHAKAYRTRGKHLLVGLLKSPDGRPWHAHEGIRYRCVVGDSKRGRYVPMADVDKPVLARIAKDMQSARFVRALVSAARDALPKNTPSPVASLRSEVQAIGVEISKLLGMATQLDDPSPVLREVDAKEKRRRDLIQRIDADEEEQKKMQAAANVSESEIRKALASMAERMGELDNEALKDLLGNLCEMIRLDPETMECTIVYRIRAASRNNLLASPRGREQNVIPLRAESSFTIDTVERRRA